jgi:hypothetical protein
MLYPPGHFCSGVLDFEDLTLGQAYNVSDVFTTGGVGVLVKGFEWTGGTWFYGGTANVVDLGMAGGSGNEINTNNANVEFMFNCPPSVLSLLFGEYGGNCNIEINGSFLNFENMIQLDGMVIGGVKVLVPVGGSGGDAGQLLLIGNIGQFAIGGQEFYLDDVKISTSVDMAFAIDGEEPCPEDDLDFGDAPEGGIAYPSPLGVIGSFPTCITVGPSNWIQHGLSWAYFGPSSDFEADGNAGTCPGCFPPYDQDECFQDGDAGLIMPTAYTIQSGAIAPCVSTVPPTPLGPVCTQAVWGVNVDIDITNNMPVDGFVNVLMDWDQDGKWGGSSSCATGAAPEHVLPDFPVPMGYSGPLSALGPPPFMIGPNSGHVWSRFSVTEQPVTVVGTDWDGSGIFEDGETEDYLIEVIDKLAIKWSQPPTYNDASPFPDCFWGWDEPSTYGGLGIWFDCWNILTQCHGDADGSGLVDATDLSILNLAFNSVYPYPPYDPCADFDRDLDVDADDVVILNTWFMMQPPRDCPTGVAQPIIADDWLCESRHPVTDVHWWGSYTNWIENVPPAFAPDRFHIGIWTDVPVGADTPWSHPGVMIWEWVVARAELSERYVGCDFHEEYMDEPDACFRYDLQLPEDAWFWQEEPETIYWISISAIYSDEPPIENVWGWKTRRHYFNGDAVRIFDPTAPVVGSEFKLGEPIHDAAGNTWDMAFELTTVDCMKGTHPDWTAWDTYGKPNCWCYRAQCYGDVDGQTELSGTVNVFMNDVNIFVPVFGSMQTTEPGVCADLDHQTELSGTVNVFMNDVSIFTPNFGSFQPDCDATHINFWLN